MQKIIQQASQLLSQGNPVAAEKLLRSSIEQNSNNEDIQALLGHSLMMQKKVDEAIDVFQKAVQQYPDSANAISELASVLLSAGKLAEAEQAFKKAVELNPTYSDAWHFLGNLLMQRGEIVEAQKCFKKSENTDPFKQHFINVQQLLSQKQFHDAEKIAREVLQQHPNHPQALFILAKLAEQIKAYEQAISILEQAIKYSPYHISLWELMAKNFAHLGFFNKSIDAAKSVVKYSLKNSNAYMLLATELANAGKFSQSLSALEQAIILSPNVANMHIQRGHVLKTLGRREECELAYKQSLAIEKNNGTAYWALADLKSYNFSDNEQKDITELFNNKKISKSQAAQAGFALAKHFEDQNDFETAFNCYEQANKLRPDTNYHADDYQRSCNLVKENFTASTLAKQAKAKNTNQATPIFIVGLTRSGSTLIEQMLASHSKVEGTMELYSLPRVVRKIELLANKRNSSYPKIMSQLSEDELAYFGQLYLEETQIFRTDKPYFIDKMPPNFHNVGLINMILPNAIVIDARRHPLSTGLSNFKQHFARGYDFSYDLKDIGHYYNCYLSLMDFWDQALPNKVFCVQYENMIQDTENQLKALLSHCDLDFEQQCLEFHLNKRSVRTASSEQVRQPINKKGMQQWKRFEEHLTPLKEALGENTLIRFKQ